MKTVWRGRVTQTVAKYGELAPTTTACCNACRTCVQTNLLTAALAGVAAAGTFIARRFRFSHPLLTGASGWSVTCTKRRTDRRIGNKRPASVSLLP